MSPPTQMWNGMSGVVNTSRNLPTMTTQTKASLKLLGVFLLIGIFLIYAPGYAIIIAMMAASAYSDRPY